jgi:hypothetical protein
VTDSLVVYLEMDDPSEEERVLAGLRGKPGMPIEWCGGGVIALRGGAARRFASGEELKRILMAVKAA